MAADDLADPVGVRSLGPSWRLTPVPRGCWRLARAPRRPYAESQSCNFVPVESGFTFIDLFAGIGGFHRALAGLDGRCVLAVEIDADAQRTYRATFPTTPLVSDVRALTQAPDGSPLRREEIRRLVPRHEVLCAGFPCQPFSKSGAQQGVLDGTRGTLFHEIMAIVVARRPRFVLLENVRNLAGPKHKDTWATIILALWAEGYQVSDTPLVTSPHLLPPPYGAPQVRDRVFILATRVGRPGPRRRDEAPLLRRGPLDGWKPDRWSVADDVLLPGVDASDFGLRSDEEGWIAAWQAFVQGVSAPQLPGHPLWSDDFVLKPRIERSMQDWKKDFLRKNAQFYVDNRPFVDWWREQPWGPLGQYVDEFPRSRRKFEWQATGHQPTRAERDLEGLVAHLRPSGIRVKAPTYLPALVAITQTSIVGPKVTGDAWRRLIPAEAARLQGIEDPGLFERAGISDKAAYKQLGNAVNVGVVRYLAEELFEHHGAPWWSPSLRLRPSELVTA